MRTLTGIVVALAVLAVPSTGLAQTQLPVGGAHGVKVVREHNAIVVVLTAKMQKRYAGKLLVVSCTAMLKNGTGGGSESVRVPAHSRKLFTGEATPKIDFCRVWAPRHGHRPKRLLVSIPLTQKGAVFLDEESKTRSMGSVLGLAGIVELNHKSDGHPTYDDLLQELPKRARAPFATKVVALAAPGDTPPAGKIGYYGDGDETIAVVTLSALGRRLFIAEGPDHVFSTNVLDYLFNEPE